MAEVRLDELRAAVDERLRGLGFDARAAGADRRPLRRRGAARRGRRTASSACDGSRAQDGIDPRGPARPARARRRRVARWDASGAVGYVALADVLAAEVDDAAHGARLVVVERCFPTGPAGLVRRARRRPRASCACSRRRRRPGSRIPDGGPPVARDEPALPGGAGPPPAVVDVSMGRDHVRRRARRRRGRRAAPGGVGRPPDGSPEDDPAEIRADRAGIRPFGGDQAHKGLALAVLVELLVAARLRVARASRRSRCSRRPGRTPPGALRELFDGRRFPGDQSRARRDAALAHGSVAVPDDLWDWIRR